MCVREERGKTDSVSDNGVYDATEKKGQPLVNVG